MRPPITHTAALSLLLGFARADTTGPPPDFPPPLCKATEHGVSINGACLYDPTFASQTGVVDFEASEPFSDGVNVTIEVSCTVSFMCHYDAFMRCPDGGRLASETCTPDGAGQFVGGTGEASVSIQVEILASRWDAADEALRAQFLRSKCADARVPPAECPADPDGVYQELAPEPLVCLGWPALQATGICCVPRRGCTDPGAVNFDPQAKVDDGSCVYREAECAPSGGPYCVYD